MKLIIAALVAVTQPAPGHVRLWTYPAGDIAPMQLDPFLQPTVPKLDPARTKTVTDIPPPQFAINPHCCDTLTFELSGKAVLTIHADGRIEADPKNPDDAARQFIKYLRSAWPRLLAETRDEGFVEGVKARQSFDCQNGVVKP